MLIVIGDIHGCFDELRALLDRIGPGDGDTIVSVGDLVDRGPKPAEVVRFFRDGSRTRAVLGNHEDKHVRWHDEGLQPATSQVIARAQASDDYAAWLDYFRGLPLHLELAEALVVHAGFEPDLPLAEQPRNVLLRCKWPDTRGLSGDPETWARRYAGDKPVVYGHSHTPEPRVIGRTFGIDTGVYAGGALTALVLPAERIVSVPARGNHWSDVRRAYAQLPRPDRVGSAEQWARAIDRALPVLEGVLAALPRPVDSASKKALGLAVASHPLASDLWTLAFADDLRGAMRRRFRTLRDLAGACDRWEAHLRRRSPPAPARGPCAGATRTSRARPTSRRSSARG